ncbi:hypothetical protein EVAR_76550_1 [Eumeta japonica]|uniref:YqaJ viral recombinase domain-containing protein n=1 Tax=Eumeta variegata TaxID=151549 RepID=A0A4C1T7W8_EUMVA|nr:hypothetical protein EVAR_76550_1 [Eumeta japonica]
MPDDVLKEMKLKFLDSLNKTDKEREHIQKTTILQRDCSEWMELRRSLLTASNFSTIIKMKQSPKCANTVKKIIYGTNLEHVASIKHGRNNEGQALKQLAEQEGINIEQCGLFIDKDLPFLGASSDGVAGDTIIELKYPITASKLGLKEAVKKKSQLLDNKRKQILANEHISQLVLPGAGPTSRDTKKNIAYLQSGLVLENP